jgi:serine-type D-Ala-D-Ala carboxypeptidase (penicillin-binding protein 5/6)
MNFIPPRLIALSLLLAGAVPAWAAPPTIDTSARNAFIVDFDTGAVLLDKGADQRMPPASMSKMMAEYVVFDFLKSGKATLDDMLPVSEKAWKTSGSKMFVPLNQKVRLEDLLRGMIIQSGNDACVVLAEGLAGSEAAFVELMNQKARDLGMTGSHFANVNGLPDPDEYMTARDLATLARHLIADFPEYYHYDSEKDFTYNGIKQGNRNPLLYEDIGADGLKTGHTDEAGYCLTASVIRAGRRIIVVLAGMNTMKERGSEGDKLIEWAYRVYNDYHLVKAGDVLDQAPVWMGEAGQVPVTVRQDVTVTLPRASRDGMQVKAVYDGPAKAPVALGQTVGSLVISAPDVPTVQVPLVASQPVAPLNAFGRMAAAAGYLVFGKRN